MREDLRRDVQRGGRIRALTRSPGATSRGSASRREPPYALSPAADQDSTDRAVRYGHPTPGTDTGSASSWPVRDSPSPSPPARSPAPRVRRDEQRPTIRAAQHAGEAAPVEVDGRQYLAAFRTRTQRRFGTSAYQTAFSASRQMPSGTPSPRSAHSRRLNRPPVVSMSKAVSRLPVGLGDDQRRVVGRHGHPVGKHQVVRYLPDRPVRSGQRGRFRGQAPRPGSRSRCC